MIFKRLWSIDRSIPYANNNNNKVLTVRRWHTHWETSFGRYDSQQIFFFFLTFSPEEDNNINRLTNISFYFPRVWLTEPFLYSQGQFFLAHLQHVGRVKKKNPLYISIFSFFFLLLLFFYVFILLWRIKKQTERPLYLNITTHVTKKKKISKQPKKLNEIDFILNSPKLVAGLC